MSTDMAYSLAFYAPGEGPQPDPRQFRRLSDVRDAIEASAMADRLCAIHVRQGAVLYTGDGHYIGTYWAERSSE